MRRPNGTGTIRWRPDAKQFECRLYVNGRRRSLYAHTEAEAKLAIARLMLMVDPNALKATQRRTIRPSVRFRVLERSGFACTYCGRRPPEVELQLDHVVPFAHGGTDDESNLRAACVECNTGKSNQPLRVVDAP